jgi:hypothetical protein
MRPPHLAWSTRRTETSFLGGALSRHQEGLAVLDRAKHTRLRSRPTRASRSVANAPTHNVVSAAGVQEWCRSWEACGSGVGILPSARYPDTYRRSARVVHTRSASSASRQDTPRTRAGTVRVPCRRSAPPGGAVIAMGADTSRLRPDPALLQCDRRGITPARGFVSRRSPGKKTLLKQGFHPSRVAR